MDASPETLAATMRLAGRALGIAAAAIGGLVLVGWALDVEVLKTILPGHVSMKANTAAGLLLEGIAVALLAPERPGAPARAAAGALAGAAALIGAATTLEWLTGRDLGLDQLLFREPPGMPGTGQPGRMAPATAISLVLLGGSILGQRWETPGGRRPAQALALVAAVFPLQAIVSYAYGVQPVHGASGYTLVALHSGFGFALLSAAVLLVQPERGFMRVMGSAGPAGFAARRLLLAIVLLPIALGWVFLVAGLRTGQYGTAAGASFAVVSAIAIGAAAVWWNTRALLRMDEERTALVARARAAQADAEAASRAKDEFIATLSHELRTPLNSVLGWSRLLRTGKLDGAGVARAVEAIERGAVTQAQIVDDLLDVARIVRGTLRLDVRPVDLVPVIEAAVDTVRPAAAARTIEVETHLVPRPGPVPGDPGRLQQVVWNLLTNAIKFTPPGGRVEVRLEQRGDQVAIRVSDDGAGIAPEFLPHVFERFRQADSSTTRAHGGLGLGLAIVRHLVEAHGGTVHASSPGPGLGSAFTVLLPLAPRPQARQTLSGRRATPPPQTHPEAPVSLSDVRVLVVDDDRDTLDLLRQLLERAGASVTAAASTDEALRALEDTRHDVILSDIGMPGQDGYELIRRVRALAPERGGSVPAAALTAFARSDRRDDALLAGYQLYLPKPIEPAELTLAVARLVGRA